jgi:hypothetical protein
MTLRRLNSAKRFISRGGCERLYQIIIIHAMGAGLVARANGRAGLTNAGQSLSIAGACHVVNASPLQLGEEVVALHYFDVSDTTIFPTRTPKRGSSRIGSQIGSSL